MRWLGYVWRIVVALLAMVVLVTTGYAWFLCRQLDEGVTTSKALDPNGTPPTTKPPVFSEASPFSQATNVLLIGLDTRKDQDGNPLPAHILDQLHAGDGDDGGYNTNTLILLHIPVGGGIVTAFSIPRDDLVDIPGEHRDKIKKAYGYAKAETETRLYHQGVTDRRTLETQGREAGRRATLAVVTQLVAVHIDHFVEVTLAGFYDLAQTLGGVPVCLNHPVQDERYSGADFPAGRQTLTASQALAFVRQRHGLTNGDLDRTHRQQAFLTSAAHQLNTLGVLTNPITLQHLIDVAKNDLVIDGRWGLSGFVPALRYLSHATLQFHTLPIVGFAKNNGEDVNLIDPVHVRRLVQSAFADGPSAPSGEPLAPHLAPRPADNGPVATNPHGRTDLGTTGETPCVD